MHKYTKYNTFIYKYTKVVRHEQLHIQSHTQEDTFLFARHYLQKYSDTVNNTPTTTYCHIPFHGEV